MVPARANWQSIRTAFFSILSVAQLAAQSPSFSEIKVRAESGEAKSQVELGIAYASSNGVAADDAEAARWFRKAAEQGNAAGEYSLGEMYTTGRGVKKDYKQASKWIQKAADQGEVRAQTDLGAMYLLGLGVNQNDKKAFQLTRTAAEQGFATAEFGLGMMYSRGQGVPRDLTEAAKWYTKAVDQGNPGAMNNLSWLLATGTNPSDRNPRAAIELALRAIHVTQERRPEYFDTLANAYFANQQYAEALGAVQKALLLKPDHIGYQQLSRNYLELTKVSPISPVTVPSGQQSTASIPPAAVFTPDPEPSSQRWYGTVIVAALVGPDGRVRVPSIVKPVSPEVDEKALDAIRNWIFRPAQNEGMPVEVNVKVEVAFPK